MDPRIALCAETFPDPPCGPEQTPRKASRGVGGGQENCRGSNIVSLADATEQVAGLHWFAEIALVKAGRLDSLM